MTCDKMTPVAQENTHWFNTGKRDEGLCHKQTGTNSKMWPSIDKISFFFMSIIQVAKHIIKKKAYDDELIKIHPTIQHIITKNT